MNLYGGKTSHGTQKYSWIEFQQKNKPQSNAVATG